MLYIPTGDPSTDKVTSILYLICAVAILTYVWRDLQKIDKRIKEREEED